MLHLHLYIAIISVDLRCLMLGNANAVGPMRLYPSRPLQYLVRRRRPLGQPDLVQDLAYLSLFLLSMPPYILSRIRGRVLCMSLHQAEQY